MIYNLLKPYFYWIKIFKQVFFDLIFLLLFFFVDKNSVIAVLIGTIAIAYIPYTIGRFFNHKVVKNNLPPLYYYLVVWVIGTFALYICYSFLHIFTGVSIPYFITTLLILMIILKPLLIRREGDSVLLYKTPGLVFFLKYSFFAVVLCYAAYLLWIPGYTQLTDLLNHSTVVNAMLMNNKFGIFPSSLTQSIQLDSYTTIFHFIFGIGRVFFSKGLIYEFSLISQNFIIIIFFWVYYIIIKKLTKSDVLSIVLSLVVVMAYGPTVSFIRYAFLPGNIIVLFAPILYWLILIYKQKKDIKIRNLIFILLSILFLYHFIVTIFLIPVFLYVLIPEKIRYKLSPYIFNFLCLVLLIFLINIFHFRFNLGAYLIDSRIVSQDLARSVPPSYMTPLYGLISFISPLFFISYIVSLIFTKKDNIKEFGELILVGYAYLLLSVLNIPFADRFGSLTMFFLPLSIALFYRVWVPNKILSRMIDNAAIIILIFTILHTSVVRLRTGEEFYRQAFWNPDTISDIKKSWELIEKNNISHNQIYIVAEPMTKMLAQSVSGSSGAGTYALKPEREDLYQFISGNLSIQSFCSKGKVVWVINNIRLAKWSQNKYALSSNIDNIWFEYNVSYLDIAIFKEIQENIKNTESDAIREEKQFYSSIYVCK